MNTRTEAPHTGEIRKIGGTPDYIQRSCVKSEQSSESDT